MDWQPAQQQGLSCGQGRRWCLKAWPSHIWGALGMRLGVLCQSNSAWCCTADAATAPRRHVVGHSHLRGFRGPPVLLLMHGSLARSVHAHLASGSIPADHCADPLFPHFSHYLQEEMYSYVTVAEDQATRGKGTVVVADA